MLSTSRLSSTSTASKTSVCSYNRTTGSSLCCGTMPMSQYIAYSSSYQALRYEPLRTLRGPQLLRETFSLKRPKLTHKLFSMLKSLTFFLREKILLFSCPLFKYNLSARVIPRWISKLTFWLMLILVPKYTKLLRNYHAVEGCLKIDD